ELSRAESGQVEIEHELVDLSQLITDVCEDFELLAAEQGLRLVSDIPQFVRIIGDRGRLRQVLINLLDNAIKYTPPGGTIRVVLSVEQPWVCLSISDTGVGIPAEDIPHIFDRFYRVDKARSRTVGGTGLGLAIVRWIVDAHGGTITLESTEGVGTTFHIRLPVVPPHLQSAEDVPPPSIGTYAPPS
ncbi:MAG: cell wall metabolism sensor histidine kinase WalK, partial [Chlorobi bacterium]|nr:cell wall metabolism sensor histidine kinase WalK [Chlorobiota bacterium]